MNKHVEMITDYLVVDEDYQYSDNKGVLTRCGDCAFANPYDRVRNRIGGLNGTIGELDFCSKAVRRVDRNP